ncbi:hypothetical protein [Thalassospira mesophila]|uniref:Uncharacterized protein n=1 Tax=Thalassospira mesophila TaxID=1293891 RepID=A0A1Y2L6D5_9PROT|nr:hypothetical protein [Thalassospira mesophila]OSQ40718.1 hypothetical protein TMES_03120 [Thalassospira mesophila]
MADISAFGPLRGGSIPTTDARLTLGHGTDSDTGSRLGRPASQAVDRLSLSPQAISATQSSDKPAATTANPLVSADGLGKDALSSSLDLIKDSVTEMFALSGMSDSDAAAATQALFDDIKDMASGTDNFDFSFKQAVASHSRSDIAYSNGNASATGFAESAMFAAQSLDISIDNTTGDFSFSYNTSKLEVSRVAVSAIGNSAGAAMGALGTALNGLGAGSLVNSLGQSAGAGDGGLLFDINGSGVADFIKDLLERTTGDSSAANATSDKDAAAASGTDTGTGTAATPAGPSAADLAIKHASDLHAQLMKQAAVIVRDVQQLMQPDENGVDKPVTKLGIELLLPLGRAGNDGNTPTFQMPDGNKLSIAANDDTSSVTA